MFEKTQTASSQEQPRVHEIKIALFDFHQNAFASQSFAIPSLIIDRQPLDERGMPGITTEARANKIGSRAMLGIPPVENISKLYLEETDTTAYVLSTLKPINFREMTLKRYELDDVIDMAHAEVDEGKETIMDTTDAKLILASLALERVRRKLPARYSVSS